jgi:methylglyoxal synthase
MVAELDCEVFIFLSDPLDRVSDVPENRALQRLSKELKVRLINTLAGAEQWALHEARHTMQDWKKSGTRKPVKAIRAGKSNINENGEPTYPEIGQQTLSLI